MPSSIERLLRHWAFSGFSSEGPGNRDGDALDMAMKTLTGIARGGIYDHVGGGFCRYATDRQWQIPHFEKMLYDNGSLLAVYADALAFGGDPLFEAAVRETADWVSATCSIRKAATFQPWTRTPRERKESTTCGAAMG